MTPELKRAIIKTNPDYFSWTIKRQESYRVNIPEIDRFEIDKYLLKDLFRIDVANSEEVDDAWRELDEQQAARINLILLPIMGIGEDLFFLNEHLGKTQTILDFETLYDYDVDDFEYQESARAKDNTGYVRQPYCGSLYLSWVRLMIDGKFSYATLSMVAGYIYSQLEAFGSNLIDRLIPHKYVHGKNHGKPESNGYLMDFKINAGGLEPQLEELRERYYNYTAKSYQRLLQEFDDQTEAYVHILDESKENEPHHHFLFSNKKALKEIRFRSFMRDCRALSRTDRSGLLECLEKEKKCLSDYINSQYRDIKKNFDSKIIKFRKKRKIIVKKDSGLDQWFD
ncbi:hypothetical protein KJ966_18225 [bacterium]|nr:hypothetical protein [bacterium]